MIYFSLFGSHNLEAITVLTMWYKSSKVCLWIVFELRKHFEVIIKIYLSGLQFFGKFFEVRECGQMSDTSKSAWWLFRTLKRWFDAVWHFCMKSYSPVKEAIMYDPNHDYVISKNRLLDARKSLITNVYDTLHIPRLSCTSAHHKNLNS